MKGGAYRWIRVPSGRWHAWPVAGGATACGAVTADRLRMRPATAVALVPPPAGEWCRICSRRLGVERESGDEKVSGWAGVIARQLIRRHQRGRVVTTAVRDFAALLAEVGEPTDQTAAHVFEVVWPLFFKVRERVPHGYRAALDACPPGARALTHLAACVEAWRAHTARTVALETFVPERVIATMLRVRDPAGYVRLLCGKEHLTYLAAVWHPDRLAKMERTTAVRGIMTGSDSYWKETAEQLRVLTD